MLPITIEKVRSIRKELIEAINQSELTQDESDIILGLFDEIIQCYEREKLESKDYLMKRNG